MVVAHTVLPGVSFFVYDNAHFFDLQCTGCGGCHIWDGTFLLELGHESRVADCDCGGTVVVEIADAKVREGLKLYVTWMVEIDEQMLRVSRRYLSLVHAKRRSKIRKSTAMMDIFRETITPCSRMDETEYLRSFTGKWLDTIAY